MTTLSHDDFKVSESPTKPKLFFFGLVVLCLVCGPALVGVVVTAVRGH